MILEADNLPEDLRGETINVIVMDMDTCIQEQVNRNADGSYTIFLNARHSYATQLFCFAHSEGHIVNRDWEKQNVQEIEYKSHNKKDHPARI